MRLCSFAAQLHIITLQQLREFAFFSVCTYIWFASKKQFLVAIYITTINTRYGNWIARNRQSRSYIYHLSKSTSSIIYYTYFVDLFSNFNLGNIDVFVYFYFLLFSSLTLYLSSFFSALFSNKKTSFVVSIAIPTKFSLKKSDILPSCTSMPSCFSSSRSFCISSLSSLISLAFASSLTTALQTICFARSA